MPNESAIEKKIRQFIDEVGYKELTTEQAKVYAAFTKTKGNPIRISTIDSEGTSVSFKMDPTKHGDGPQHILTKHYKGTIGRVTAIEILNMCEAIRNGKKDYSGNCVYYEYTKKYSGVMHTIFIKIGTRDKYLKTFYSDRDYVEKKKGLTHPVCSPKGVHAKKRDLGDMIKPNKLSKPASSSPRWGRHRNSGRNAKLEKRGKNTKKTK